MLVSNRRRLVLKSRVPVLIVLAAFAALLAACGSEASATDSLKVLAAYADNLQAYGTHQGNPPSFPDPWQGAPNVDFKGTGPQFDSGAIRIQNTTGDAVTVQSVSVAIADKTYDLWGANLQVPANSSLILTQTQLGAPAPGTTAPLPNFDTSEVGNSAVPVIHLRINGTTTDYRDTGRILTTGGTDIGNGGGSRNESHGWQVISAVGGQPTSSGFNPTLLFLVPVAAMLATFLKWIPALIGALLLLVIGWFIARVIGRLVFRGLETLGFGAAVERTGLLTAASRGGVGTYRRHDASWFLSRLVAWSVFLFFVMMAAQALGVPAVTHLFEQVIAFIPNLIVALIVVVLGLLAAQAVGAAVRRMVAGPTGNLVGTLAGVLIIALTTMVALTQLHIADNLILVLFGGLILAITLALGLAFGLGGERTVRQMASRWSGPMSTVARPSSAATPPSSTATSAPPARHR